MNVDWEKFTTAYTNAPTETKNLIDSDTLPLIAEYLCLKFSLAPEMKRSLVVCLINKTLGLSTDPELTQALSTTGIPAETAERILLAAEAKMLETSATQTDASLPSGGIPPLRTMPPAPTAPEETVYTSTQAAILHESTATPPTTDPNAPRWDTAR